MHPFFVGKRDVELATHILQFIYHSSEGVFHYPYAYYPTANLNGAILVDLYWRGVAALLHAGFNPHMGICDGGQANRSMILLHFDSEEDAISKEFVTINPYNEEAHAFMMDPSVSKMLYIPFRSNIMYWKAIIFSILAIGYRRNEI